MYSPAPIRINTNNVVVSGFTLQGGMASIYGGGGDGIQVIGNVMDMALELTGSNQIVANNTVGTSDPHSLGDIESNGNNNVIADNKADFRQHTGNRRERLRQHGLRQHRQRRRMARNPA